MLPIFFLLFCLGWFAQVVITGVLSAHGPLQIMNHTTPNKAIMSFPYAFVASLFVISALNLSVLALRKIKNPISPSIVK